MNQISQGSAHSAKCGALFCICQEDFGELPVNELAA